MSLMINFPNSASHATVASYFLFGLEAGIFEEDCAKDWAFNIIALSENPTIDIIEVATANRRAEVFEALNRVAGKRDNMLAGQWLLHDLHTRGEANLASVDHLIRQAMHISRACGLPDDVYYSFDSIDDELFLAKNGAYGTVEQCRLAVIYALAEFSINPKAET
jgi:hypothetical protein